MMRSGRRAALLAGIFLAGNLLAAVSLPAAGVQASTGLVSARTSPSPVSRETARALAQIRDRRPGSLAAAASPFSLTGLNGVFCTSAQNCWAVGSQQSGAGKPMLNQILHWNGKTWRKAPVPNPGGTANGDVNELFAIRCLNGRSCWAVGEDSRGGLAVLNQALHWNGRNWSKVRTPNPGGSKKDDVNELFDVTCTSAANCWTVGDFGTPMGPNQKLLNQVLHWNGKIWSRVRTINPGGTSAGHLNSLFSVRCGSAGSCIAVGDYGTASGTSTYLMLNEALHWNGKRWSKVRTPDPGGTRFGNFSQLDALACSSPTSCWGAGSYGTNEPTTKSLNEILHWNGKKWTKSTTPNPGGTGLGDSNQLVGGTCSSARNCWTVGSYDTNVGARVNEALHWNGKRWSLIHTPSPGKAAKDKLDTLEGVRCTSDRNCWAVGFQGFLNPGKFLDEILHWNGRKWSVR